MSLTFTKALTTGLRVTDSVRKNSPKEQVLSYYEKAGPDYEVWSRKFNMHFGYYEQGVSPFRREALLENMNRKVLSTLGIKDTDQMLIDMGCGLGGTLRFAARNYPHLELKGVTIVPWQIKKGNQLNKAEGLNRAIQLLQEDYSHTSIPDNSVDLVLAIESSCYAGGTDKGDLLSEIHRILRPGGRFVVADGLLRHRQPMNYLVKNIYRRLCDSWALSGLGVLPDMERTLNALGFEEMRSEDISWNVAPSVAHVPGTVLFFLIRQLLFGKEKMNKERWDNLRSPLLTIIIGLVRSHFGYYLISGTKQSIL